MLVALDSPSPQAKRIYADDDIGEGNKYKECYKQIEFVEVISMKKIIAIVLCLVLTLSLVGCGNAQRQILNLFQKRW